MDIQQIKSWLNQKVLSKDDILNLLKQGKLTYKEYAEIVGYETVTETIIDEETGEETIITKQVPPTVDIDTLKANRLLRLKIECANAIYKGFLTTINSEPLWIDFDNKAQQNINQQTTMYILNPDLNEIQWNTKTYGEYQGKVVTLTKEQFMQLVSESASHKQSNFQKYWAKVEQINNAITPEEISAIVWEGLEDGEIDENSTI